MSKTYLKSDHFNGGGSNAGQTFDPKNVMHYFTSKQVPVISRLARQFAVCDRWFASAPCQTWPNRWFVHAATADGHENNRPIHLPDVETVFNRFEQAGIGDWKIYFHDIAQAHTLLNYFFCPIIFTSIGSFKLTASAVSCRPIPSLSLSITPTWLIQKTINTPLRSLHLANNSSLTCTIVSAPASSGSRRY